MHQRLLGSPWQMPDARRTADFSAAILELLSRDQPTKIALS
jgi:hypothetical protein